MSIENQKTVIVKDFNRNEGWENLSGIVGNATGAKLPFSLKPSGLLLRAILRLCKFGFYFQTIVKGLSLPSNTYTYFPHCVLVLLLYVIKNKIVNLLQYRRQYRQRLIQHRIDLTTRLNIKLNNMNAPQLTINENVNVGNIEKQQDEILTLASERNYVVRHTKESIEEFQIVIMGVLYTLPSKPDFKTYWNKSSSPSGALKSSIRGLRQLLLKV